MKECYFVGSFTCLLIATKFQVKILDGYVKDLMESDNLDATREIQELIITGKRKLCF